MLKRTPVAAGAAALMFSLAPATALAHDGGREHHGAHHRIELRHRHHVEAHHQRHVEHVHRFGHPSVTTTTPTAPAPTATGATPTTTVPAPTTTVPTPTTTPAGTVTSYVNGTLTITLANGSTVSGAVDPRTRLECEAPNHAYGFDSVRTDDHGSGGGSNSGSGNSGPGDSGSGNGDRFDHDNGDNDRGDDNGDNDRANDNMCTVADLTPGTAVEYAQLDVTSAGPIWDELDLDA